jgi:hypothetical protein
LRFLPAVSDDAKYERPCRLGLLAVAAVHWIAFLAGLLGRVESEPESTTRAFLQIVERYFAG